MKTKEEELKAMRQILSGRIDNPYLKGLNIICKEIRKYIKKNQEVPKDLEKAYKIQLDKCCKWKL